MSNFLFVADDGVHGNTVWRTGGTAGGTQMLKDPSAGGPGEPTTPFVDVNGETYFVAPDGANGLALWRTDGTAAGTAVILHEGAGGPDEIGQLTEAGGKLFFSARDPAHGDELWTSDGTTAGTHIVTDDILAGPGGSGPFELTEMGGLLYFGAFNGLFHSGTVPIGDDDLYVTDGTAAGTHLVKDPEPDVGPYAPFDVTAIDGKLFFEANHGYYRSSELWSSDGTANGTNEIAQIGLVIGGIYGQITGSNGLVFFVGANSDNQIPTLYVSDGTAAGTLQVRDPLHGGGPEVPDNLTDVDGTLFFTTGNPFFSDGMLWTSDGTAAGTNTIYSGPASNLASFAGKLYFAGGDAAHGGELWTSDGSAGGTHLVKDINHGAADSSPFHFETVGGKLYFDANDGAHGIELWVSDGTAAGTHMVKDIEPGAKGGLDPNHDPTPQDDHWIISHSAVHIPASLILSNDSDPDGDDLDIVSIGNAVGGTVSLDNGIIDFTPSAGAGHGVASFDYTVQDPLGSSASATVFIDIPGTGPGNDTVEADATTEIVYARGGAGDDSLAGSGGPDTLIGGTGNDTVEGNAGDDRLEGGKGNDFVSGGDGDDAILGGDGNDSLLGGDGQDGISGGPGDDYIYAPDGDSSDSFTGGPGRDTFQASAEHTNTTNFITDFTTGPGGDMIDLRAFLAHAADAGTYAVGDNPFTTGLLELMPWGTSVLLLTPDFSDTLFEIEHTRVEDFTADNFLPGYSPDGIGEHITGTGGPDTLTGTINNDTMDGGAGADSISSGIGDDRIYGGPGSDALDGGHGRNTIDGGAGDDSFYLTRDRDGDVLTGGAGRDSYGLDLTFGNAAADRVTDFTTGPGGDVLSMQGYLATANVLLGYVLGSNPFETGFLRLVQSGSDTLVQVHDGTTALILSNTRVEDFTADNFSPGFTLNGIGETIDGGSGPDTLAGTVNDDLIRGHGGADSLNGGDGDDTVDGGAGNDTILGGRGFNTLIGGDGDDELTAEEGGRSVFFGGAGADVFHNVSNSDFIPRAVPNGIDTFTGGEGVDTYEVFGNLRFDLPDVITDFTTGPGGDILDLEFAGTHFGPPPANPFLTGTARLVQSGSDTLLQTFHGQARTVLVLQNTDADAFTADNFYLGFNPHALNVIVGTAGADQLNGVGGRDLVFALGGDDTIDTGAGNDTIVAGEGNNVVRAGDGDDVIDAGSGADTIETGAGHDVVRSGEGADSVLGGRGFDEIFTAGGNDTVGAGSGSDYVESGAGNDSTAGGDGNDTLVAGDGDDSLAGGRGGDALRGEAGNDTITGGAGVDTMAGGPGSDVFRYDAAGDTSVFGAGGRDIIVDFSHAQADRIDLSAVDASTVAVGNQAFAFIGTGAFTGVSGQLRYADVGSDTLVQADTNGDGTADFEILLKNHTGQGLVAGDFVL